MLDNYFFIKDKLNVFESEMTGMVYVQLGI